jgi:hypothetical protein
MAAFCEYISCILASSLYVLLGAKVSHCVFIMRTDVIFWITIERLMFDYPCDCDAKQL